MVPVQLPSTSLGTMSCFCSSDPAVSRASTTPSVSRGHSENARLAAFTLSTHGVPTSLGKPCPPNSVGCCKPCQPPCVKPLKASLKPDEVLTLPSCHFAGEVSPTRFRGAMTSCTKRAFSASTASTRSGDSSWSAGNCWISDKPASSFSTKRISCKGATYDMRIPLDKEKATPGYPSVASNDPLGRYCRQAYRSR